MTVAAELELIIGHIKEYPEIDAHELKEFCQEHEITIGDFSGAMYKLLSSFFVAGESSRFPGRYSRAEMVMGIPVEMEHTTCRLIAEKIAMDHLAEIPDYYTRLAAMEADAGRVKRRSTVVIDDERSSLNATEIAIGRLL